MSSPGPGPSRSPFADVAPAVVGALAVAAVTVVWLVFGDALPGGRWLAVHLFTLGVLSNLVMALSQHFAVTITRTPAFDGPAWPTLVFNAGVVGVFVGMAAGIAWLSGVGASVALAGVFGSWQRLSRARRQALGPRFGWIVRIYQRAHGAFIHGALLGGVMGAAVVGGAWYASARTAHLHAMVLGWGGLTLLATLVFFGPTMARCRIGAGADERAARRLRWAAHALTIAVLGLLLEAVGGLAGTAIRIAAALALAVYAWAATATCRDVAAAVRDGGSGASRRPTIALCRWLVLVAWADVAIVAFDAGRWLDALGVAVLVGVLLQAIATTLVYLAPMLRGRGRGHRDRIREALERGMGLRSTAFNVGVALVVFTAFVGTEAGYGGAVLATIGWVLVMAALAQAAVVGLLVPPPEQS